MTALPIVTVHLPTDVTALEFKALVESLARPTGATRVRIKGRNGR